LGTLIAQSATAARTITVGPGRDYATIQAAIDGASEGDTIIVYPGNYVETITVNKDIVLRSTNPADPMTVTKTIIDGNQTGVPVVFQAWISDKCVLSGFTITRGAEQGIWGNDSHALIEYNIITGNFGITDAGGMASCNGTIRNNIIKGNNNGCDGGGLVECDGIIENNVIVGNAYSGLSGCGYDAPPGASIIRNNIIADSGVSAWDGLGGYGIVRCNGTIENNAIVANVGEIAFGGGLYQCQGTIRNCIVWGNGPNQLSESATPTYSCIEGWTGGGVGNIAADPSFLIPAPGDDDPSTYVLSPDSPCIDAGNPGPQFNDRYRPPGQGTPRNDMGAYGGPHNFRWLSKFIVVRSPNGGETFNVGTLQEVRWEASPGIQNLDVFFLFRNGDLQTRSLALGAPNTGTIGRVFSDTPWSECYIRVVDAADPATSDTSDAPFSIGQLPPVMQVRCPNGGELYLWGQQIPVQWASWGTSYLVGMHFSSDGGATWAPLVSSTPNDGACSSPAPQVNSNKCLISVYDPAANPPVFDVSDAPFAVFSDPLIARPNFRFVTADFYPAAPTQMRPGYGLAISALVENRGKTASPPAWLEVWGSRTGGITLDYFLCISERLDPIPPDGTFSLNRTTALFSIPDGPYTVVYAIDRPDVADELEEGDNRFVVSGKRLLVVRPPTQANLTIDGFEIGPNPIYSMITLGGWVRNTGTEDSGPFWIEFWGSTNRIFPQLDFFLCDSIMLYNLPPGDSIFLGYYARSLYPYPVCPSGTFMAGVFVDRPDAVNETDETDNYAFIDGIVINNEPPLSPAPPSETEAVRVQSGPDLVVVNGDCYPVAPVVLSPGDLFYLRARVENQGQADSGPFWLEFWGSRLGGLSPNDMVCDSIYVPNVGAGQAFGVDRAVPIYSMPDGPYTLTIDADRLGDVADANPRNNRLAVAGKRVLTIRPQTQANLRTENFAVTTTTLRRGQPLGVSGQVRNTGAQDTGPFWIEFWGSLNQMYPDLNFFLCDSISVPNLAAGEALDLASYPRTLYDTAPTGPCMILCFPDRPDFVNETDETDNPAAIGGCRIES
jgi:hypothetical protein